MFKKSVPPQMLEEATRERILACGSEAERLEFHKAGRLLNPKSCKVRSRFSRRMQLRHMLNRWLGAASGVHLPPIPRKTGFVICRPTGFTPLESALEEAGAAFRSYNPGTNKRDYDSLEGVPRLDRTPKSAINQFAMHPEVVHTVTRYLGLYPVLYRINLLYSPNDKAYEKSSQFFHLDPEDTEQVKIFIWVEDVDKEAGPFMLLPANLSRKVRHHFNYKNGRVHDKGLFSVIKPNDVLTCTGQAGTMVFADTSRCFHMGSRQGSRPRYAIMIQYVTPFAATFPLQGESLDTKLGPLAVPPMASDEQKYLLGVKR